jgi:hypothetical protein
MSVNHIFKKIKHFYITRSKKNGSVLLLALFIMAAMMIVALGLAALAIKQINQTKDIRQSTISFYVAESGVEEGLYQLRKMSAGVSTLTTKMAANGDFEVVNPADAYYRLQGWNNETLVYDHLNKNEVTGVDLLNVDNVSGSSFIKTIGLQWDGKPLSWLEVTWRSLGTGGFYNPSLPARMRLLPFSEGGGEQTIDLTVGDPSYPMHSVEIKALYDEVKNLRIKAYDQNGVQVNIPSRIYVSASGEYPKGVTTRARNNITVSLPAKTPLSPMFDYVVFSENNLEKNILIAGSLTPQLIYDDCGPYVYFPDCQHTFSATSTSYTFLMRNIGINTATIGAAPSINPSTGYTIDPNNCTVGTTLEYDQTCSFRVTASSGYQNAILSVATSTLSTVDMQLYRGGH